MSLGHKKIKGRPLLFQYLHIDCVNRGVDAGDARIDDIFLNTFEIVNVNLFFVHVRQTQKKKTNKKTCSSSFYIKLTYCGYKAGCATIPCNCAMWT